MNITDVRIQLLKNPRSKLVAFASVTFNNVLVIRDFQIFASVKGYFVGMPSRQQPDGTWRETVFPIDTEFAEKISRTVLRAFEDEREKPENHLNQSGSK
jgi:stage V sporulation protein G